MTDNYKFPTEFWQKHSFTSKEELANITERYCNPGTALYSYHIARVVNDLAAAREALRGLLSVVEEIGVQVSHKYEVRAAKHTLNPDGVA
jgi:hypothetical protein